MTGKTKLRRAMAGISFERVALIWDRRGQSQVAFVDCAGTAMEESDYVVFLAGR